MKEWICEEVPALTMDGKAVSTMLYQEQELVRCKDCKYGKIHGIDVECVAHEEVSYDPEPWHPLDWFCADGEWKEDR